MRICIAQTQSTKGEVQKNLQNHLQFIDRAIELNADVIIFPELSITGYELDIAKEIAKNTDHNTFTVFQKLSNKNQITIGVGMPTHTLDGTNISMLIFQSVKDRIVYSKQILHSDELPYFNSGISQTFLKIKGYKIAIGICYETLHPKHFLNAIENGANIYIASVAKGESGINKAYSHFSKIAKKYNTPILMSNCVGFCDNFISTGQSAIWNENGELMDQLDTKNQGVLIYDTKVATSEVYQFKVLD